MTSSSGSPSLRLDRDNGRLWLGTREIRLRPKAFAVLHTLVEQAGRIVSREELVRLVWPGTKVSEVVLRGCLREIRQALGDSAQSPQFVETIPRRGWRFLLPPTAVHSLRTHRTPSAHHSQFSYLLVDREKELAQLWEDFEKAQRGERRVVFVSGEVGIGKTALLDAFLARVVARTDANIARGQCIEQYGAGEPYLPVLEALDRLCRTPAKKQLIPLLRQQAPFWLLQMPGLVTPADKTLLQESLRGTSQDRMLREIAVFIEAATAKRCLILVLEDLHWSDISTLALISSLARRREAARLLIVGVYQPTKIVRRRHVLRGLLQDLAHCESYRELPLAGLDEDAVSTYVAQRFPGNTFPATIGKTIYRRTEGNPLFVVNTISHLVSQGLIVSRSGLWTWQGQETPFWWSIPETVRHVIEEQLDGLSQEEQRLLEVGSVAGMEFSAAVVAATLGKDLIPVEEYCDTLARHHLFLRGARTRVEQERRLATRYRFLHSLYLNVIYDRISQARRRQLHRFIGMYKEQEYGARAAEVASELAVHFKEGREYYRTVHYLVLAAKTAMQRQAQHEARNHLRQAQALLATLPESSELEEQLREIQRTLESVNRSGEAWIENKIGGAALGIHSLDRHLALWCGFATIKVLLSVTTTFAAV